MHKGEIESSYCYNIRILKPQYNLMAFISYHIKAYLLNLAHT